MFDVLPAVEHPAVYWCLFSAVALACLGVLLLVVHDLAFPRGRKRDRSSRRSRASTGSTPRTRRGKFAGAGGLQAEGDATGPRFPRSVP